MQLVDRLKIVRDKPRTLPHGDEAIAHLRLQATRHVVVPFDFVSHLVFQAWGSRTVWYDDINWV
jgi:hypothetical protein